MVYDLLFTDSGANNDVSLSLSCVTELQYKKNMVGYPHNIQSAIARMGKSC